MEKFEFSIEAGKVTVVFTAAADGDFQIDTDLARLENTRRSITSHQWTWFRQVHGNNVLTVSSPGEHAGEEADGSITSEIDCPLSITTADCPPVVLVGSKGVAVVHAGWKGLEAGIIQEAALRLFEAGSTPCWTLLGPHITVKNYEFGSADLERISLSLGEQIRGKTTAGTDALDLYAGVSAACVSVGWPRPEPASCTSNTLWYSHRIRADRGRQATVAWISDA